MKREFAITVGAMVWFKEPEGAGMEIKYGAIMEADDALAAAAMGCAQAMQEFKTMDKFDIRGIEVGAPE